MIRIPLSEFSERISRIQEAMKAEKLDALLVYGDEYRREQLRYVCNFWPIFERGACVIPVSGDPIVIGAPEGEKYAQEMSAWSDLRNVKDFACVSVPEEIDYPLAQFTSLKEILGEAMRGGRRLGLVGSWDIPHHIHERITTASENAEIVNCDSLMHQLRLIKSQAEIDCLREAGRMACQGYEKLIAASVPGNTELEAAAAGEGAARAVGAEAIVFMVYGSGARASTIIGRPTSKMIQDGDMIMAAMAVQYQGYIATVEYPFVAGQASKSQKYFLEALFKAAEVQLGFLTDGAISGEMVKAVQAVFAEYGLSEYDVYPPMHGIGLAEAESPYPDSKATYPLKAGMCVNSDISLFGHASGSNRLEEGFVITENGPESLTPYIRNLCENQWMCTEDLLGAMK